MSGVNLDGAKCRVSGKRVELAYTPDPKPVKPGLPKEEAPGEWAAYDVERARYRKEKKSHTVRVLRAEIVDAFNVRNAHPDCDTDLRAVKKSLTAMMRCSARPMTSIQAACWHRDRYWRQGMDAETAEALAVTEIDEEWVKERKRVVGRMLPHACPCLPSSAADAVTHMVIERYGSRLKRVLREGIGFDVFKPPQPLRWRGRPPVRVETDGHFLYVDMPLRTGRLCPFAMDPPKRKKNKDDGQQAGDEEEAETTATVNCLLQQWKYKDQDGVEHEVVCRPTRGAEDKTVYVTLKFKISGKGAHAVLKSIMSGEYQRRDITISWQGNPSGRGKKSMMLALSYRMPRPQPKEGGKAVLVFGSKRIVFALTEQGRGLWSVHEGPVADKLARFDGEKRLVEMRAKKDAFRKRAQLNRWEAHRPPKGARGHGKPRRFRTVTDVEGREKFWVENESRDIARVLVDFARRENLGQVWIGKYKEDPGKAEDVPCDKRHLFLRFPRGHIGSCTIQALARDGVAAEMVDEPALLPCPVCGQRKTLAPTEGNLKCGSCEFIVDHDWWRAVGLLGAHGVDISEMVAKCLREDQMKRKAQKKAAEARLQKRLFGSGKDNGGAKRQPGNRRGKRQGAPAGVQQG